MRHSRQFLPVLQVDSPVDFHPAVFRLRRGDEMRHRIRVTKLRVIKHRLRAIKHGLRATMCPIPTKHFGNK